LDLSLGYILVSGSLTGDRESLQNPSKLMSYQVKKWGQSSINDEVTQNNQSNNDREKTVSYMQKS
jgi:hypothetical protein